MEIKNSGFADIEEIFRLYAIATAYQKERSPVYWPVFEHSLVETEINEGRQWKMVDGDNIACIWAITFSDPQIWEERNTDPAVYIHRIATHPAYRGRNLVLPIVEWARAYARENGKHFVRLDTVGENHRLIKLYNDYGFNFLGLFQLADTAGLPAHYDHAIVSLFELEV